MVRDTSRDGFSDKVLATDTYTSWNSLTDRIAVIQEDIYPPILIPIQKMFATDKLWVEAGRIKVGGNLRPQPLADRDSPLRDVSHSFFHLV